MVQCFYPVGGVCRSGCVCVVVFVRSPTCDRGLSAGDAKPTVHLVFVQSTCRPPKKWWTFLVPPAPFFLLVQCFPVLFALPVAMSPECPIVPHREPSAGGNSRIQCRSKPSYMFWGRRWCKSCSSTRKITVSLVWALEHYWDCSRRGWVGVSCSLLSTQP